MRVRRVMSRQVIAGRSTDTILDAGRRMRSDGVSALPITNNDEIVGILSERDLVDALLDGADPRTTRVSRYMTSHPHYASPDDDSHDVALRMLHLGIRHIPVVEEGRLVGMVSARDLLLLEDSPPDRL